MQGATTKAYKGDRLSRSAFPELIKAHQEYRYELTDLNPFPLTTTPVEDLLTGPEGEPIRRHLGHLLAIDPSCGIAHELAELEEPATAHAAAGAEHNQG